MKIVFHEYAVNELNDAIDYYNLEVPGLGSVFKEEIRKSINRIKEYPESWPIMVKSIHKYLLHKFPYKVLYSIETDHIYIIAIAHQHRKPNYWIERK